MALWHRDTCLLRFNQKRQKLISTHLFGHPNQPIAYPICTTFITSSGPSSGLKKTLSPSQSIQIRGRCRDCKPDVFTQTLHVWKKRAMKSHGVWKSHGVCHGVSGSACRVRSAAATAQDPAFDLHDPAKIASRPSRVEQGGSDPFGH